MVHTFLILAPSGRRVPSTLILGQFRLRPPQDGGNLDFGDSPPRQRYLGYGNDSVRNGPLSSQSLHIVCEAVFAFSVETRTRRGQARGS